MNKEGIETRVLELAAVSLGIIILTFHSNTNCPGNQYSHGKNLVKLERLKDIFSLIQLGGKSVLDVGCNEGFFSQYMSHEGANVQGIDIDPLRIEKARFVRSLLSNDSNPKFDVVISIHSNLVILKSSIFAYTLDFCIGSDPFTAVAALANKTDMILFEWKCLKFGAHDESFAYFSTSQLILRFYGGILACFSTRC